MAGRWKRLFSHARQTPTQPTEAPVRMHWIDTLPQESSDKPCTVKSLDVAARVVGLYAEVTQTIALYNPNNRPLSADLSIPLPDRAVVCGYALEIDGALRDGVVVEKERARVAFEMEQRRGVDPGLVEAVRGNVYRTRVYPVPARSTRTVQLRYVAPLLLTPDGSATLDLPMPPERLAQRSVRVDVQMLDCPRPVLGGLGSAMLQEQQGYWSASVTERDVEPSEHVRVAMPQLPSSFALLEQDEEGAVWFCASVTDTHHAHKKHVELKELTVLWDASGSRAHTDHSKELELLRAYCDAPTLQTMRLVVFGERVREVRSFASAQELMAHVRSIRYDGGTNFNELASTMESLSRAGRDEASASVLFTDGMDTLTDTPFSLPSSCNALAIVSGSERDTEALRQACQGRAFDLDAAPKDAVGLAQVLSRPASHGVLGVVGSGIADVCDVGSIGANRRAVLGRLVDDTTQLTFEGGTSLTLTSQDAPVGTTIAHAWAARRVALLSPNAENNDRELLRLGTRFGIVSPVTSLLVLETVDQWIRHELEPPTSWESMHDAWVRAQKGAMRLGPKYGNEQAHRRVLISQWRHTMAWWKHDFSKDDTAMPDYCPRCGALLAPDTLFCMRCGERLSTWQESPLPTSSHMADALPLAQEPAAASRPTPRAMPDSSTSRGHRDSAEFRAQPTAAGLRSTMRMARSAAPMAAAPRPVARSAAPMALSARPMAVEADMSAEESPAGSTGSLPNLSDAGEVTFVSVRPWMPDTPYLKALDTAFGRGADATHDAYFLLRQEYYMAPSFFLDCAGWFMEHEDEVFSLQILSNLAEIRIDDAALLRVMGWRLREAGKLELALVALRRAMKLRKEDGQGYRDVALVLEELARTTYANNDKERARAYAEEAGELYRTCALTPWRRHPLCIGLFAVEEYNVFRAWASEQEWETPPELPSLGEELEGVPACDLRITLAWDADETDVDIHVTEPSGEEAYYGHRDTLSGGRVSEDIRDGYGPEQYEIRAAQEGTYCIRAHYFASHQQALFGPATCTLTIFTDWGRPGQRQRATITRLDRQKEMVLVGTASYGDVAKAETEESDFREYEIRRGMSVDKVIELLGEPTSQTVSDDDVKTLTWERDDGRQYVVLFVQGHVTRALEEMPWGYQMIIVQ